LVASSTDLIADSIMGVEVSLVANTRVVDGGILSSYFLWPLVLF
jgi:hypothetical protein